jgi:hypothetical protein
MTDAVIVTTTINLPVETFEKLGSVATLIVAGDKKTPDETRDLVQSVDGIYLGPEDQEHWACSRDIGWNSIQRRNIAFLEAYQTGAEIVITVDDDNCPEDPEEWLAAHIAAFDLVTRPTYVTSTDSGWFNPGSMLSPNVWARGMPNGDDYSMDSTGLWTATYSEINDLRVGVNAGLWLGDPDIDAMQRITQAPYVTSMLTSEDTLVLPGCYSPINSQNTAWRRELLPLAAVWPYAGRWDDIFGGYLAQWSFWAAGYGTRYGLPLVRQERNEHDLYTDLKHELNGMRNTVKFIQTLVELNQFVTGNPLTDIRTFVEYITLSPGTFNFPPGLKHFLLSWVHDWAALGMEA